MNLSTPNLELIRTHPQENRLYLSVFSPRLVFQAQINDPTITKGQRTIPFNNVTFGSDLSVESGTLIRFGSATGGKDIGSSRVKSITSVSVTIAENSDLEFLDDQFISIYRFFPVLPVYPRIINNPNSVEDVIFFKDYDIPYSNQNSILGTFISMGSHRAAFTENGSAQLWYTASGTHNLVTGTALSYDWAFEGGNPTGSTVFSPGYVSYSAPGDYVTRLTVSGSNGSVDTSYRYVSIYNPIASGTNLPYLQWSLDNMDGSRDEGGYTASITVYQPVESIEEGSVIVIFADDWYGATRQTLGGNGENNSKIFFVGYVMDGSIRYDYEKSTVKFDVGSITRYMKEMDGFSVSVESHSAPSTWYQLLDLDITRAIYHYLKWHSTVLSTVDFEFTPNTDSNNPKIQFFDADRSSLYDAVDNFMRSAIVGKTVADRQGKIWAERDITIFPTGTFPQVMGITNRDWMEQPSIDELMIQGLSYLEMGGIAFSGISTGTFAALMACAPGGAPSYRGGTERTQGLALTGQTQLNQIVQNIFTFKNYRFQSIDMPLTGKYSNLDIAPQEPVNIIVEPSDTVRRVNIRNDFNVNSMSWEFNAKDSLLLPRVTWKPIVNGTHIETIAIPDTPEAGGFNTPSIQVPNIPSMAFPASFGAFLGGIPISFIEFDCDGASSLGNLWVPFNSVTDRVGDVSWFQYAIGSSPACGILSAGLYGIFFQTGIGSAAPGKTFIANVGAGFTPPNSIVFGISVLDPNDSDVSYVSCGTLFEMPNSKAAIGNNNFDPAVYIDGDGTNFNTFNSLLKIAKFR